GENARLAERAADLHDIGQRVLRLLLGESAGAPELPPHPVILVADDLTPSEAARLDATRILGICTAQGGPTSHTAIIARSIDLPAIVGAGPEILALANGTEAVLDGTAGVLHASPTPADLASARRLAEQLRRRRGADFIARYQPAVMTDGARIEVAANIKQTGEAASAVEMGAEGVGLMRTEFLFLDRGTAPTEDEQYEAYRDMIRDLNGLPLILRTLDIGGDKLASYIALPKEENPFLGIRGLRLCLRQPEIFLPQLRAIYRASAHGPVKIMFPMVTTVEDFREAREHAEAVRAEIGADRLDLGIMVEVPAAALMARELAREVDFFSIGTNDLTQYVLAMDRLHASLAKNVDGLHPAVLRLVEATVNGARAEGKWVGVCGGVAGDPLGAILLAGLGVSELSVSPPAIPAVKAALRRLSLLEARHLAARALACPTATAVRQLSLP
ncbi:MAG TPA: phosphoenolpyruvate--protein phosphotransferase, partial [Candidatus Methylacidiphilales bacterium]